jgi:hypothetical protein
MAARRFEVLFAVILNRSSWGYEEGSLFPHDDSLGLDYDADSSFISSAI